MEFDPLSRLVIISNRVSAPNGSHSGAQGGLAVALASALQENGGIWFGWSGEETDEFTGQITFTRAEGVTTATVDLEAQDVEEYYNGYANRTLWPLFHYRVDLAEYEREFAGGYKRVNVRFAETVRPLRGTSCPREYDFVRILAIRIRCLRSLWTYALLNHDRPNHSNHCTRLQWSPATIRYGINSIQK